MMRHLTTGQLPGPTPPPSSPLIDALERIPPRLRGSMLGFEVGPDLGYMGWRVFQTAAQALLWLRPPHAGSSHPAESWRDKRFQTKLWLDDLLSRCASHHESMACDLPHLINPAAKPLASAPSSAHGSTARP